MHGRTAALWALLGRGTLDVNAWASYNTDGGLFHGPLLLFSLCGTDVFKLIPDFFYSDAALALLEAGADPNVGDLANITPLHRCAFFKEGVGTRHERLAVARALLDRGAATDFFTSFDHIIDTHPLHAAIYTNFYEAAELLIQAVAPMDTAPFLNRAPPLFFAARWGRVDMFQLLLSAGADINAVDRTGYNVLH